MIELGVRKLRDDPVATINRAIAIAAYSAVNLSVIHDGTEVMERRFPQLTIRGNIIRHVDNLSDPSQKPRAMEIWNTENALIENNFIKIDRSTPIECFKSRTFPTFKNQTPNGNLILAVDADTGAKYPDRELTVEQSLEEAMLTSFLK